MGIGDFHFGFLKSEAKNIFSINLKKHMQVNAMVYVLCKRG